jgi:aspartate/methionine/tyrosine aminotransferase
VHVPLMTLDGMAERTVTLNSLSKTFSVTGWRVGWAVSPPALAGPIRKVHDFLTVGAPAPLQDAGAYALSLPDTYYRDLAAHYQTRRDRVIAMLERAGLGCLPPQGAYYVMTDISRFGFADDVAFTRFLVEEIGVAAVPGSSFYSEPSRGADRVRFCFCKRDETLDEAERRLVRLAARAS